MPLEPLDDLEDYVMPESYGATIGKCLTFDEIQALLAAERERCAKVAEKLTAYWGLPAKTASSHIARAIRNLPPQAEGGQT